MAEPKLDGWRVQVSVVDGEVSVRTRGGRRIRPQGFDQLGRLGLDVVLDGELVSGSGRSQDFYKVVSDLGRAGRPNGLTFAAFDVLWVAGHSATDLRYDQRRVLLEGLDLTGRATLVRTFKATALEELLASCEALGVEGLVLKDRSSRYEPGRRSTAWRKVKAPHWRAVHGPKRRNWN